jgi:hypothetical protein
VKRLSGHRQRRTSAHDVFREACDLRKSQAIPQLPGRKTRLASSSQELFAACAEGLPLLARAFRNSPRFLIKDSCNQEHLEDDFMSASNQNVMLALLSPVVLISFLILMTAIKSDNMLRIILAGVGLLAFGGLLAALLVAKFKGLNS